MYHWYVLFFFTERKKNDKKNSRKRVNVMSDFKKYFYLRVLNWLDIQQPTTTLCFTFISDADDLSSSQIYKPKCDSEGRPYYREGQRNLVIGQSVPETEQDTGERYLVMVKSAGM